MYENIKKNIVKLLGREFLKKNEIPIRRVFLYPFYIGNKKYCPVCKKNIKNFIHLSSGELLCPYCGSLKRNRRLASLIEPKLTNGISVLEFSPSKCLNDTFKKNKAIKYTSSDFVGEFKTDKQYDITQIEVDSESYDLILCYHILEHVENDVKAMSELYRVVKKGGTCFIQTPFKTGEIYEDLTITDPKERTIHFGQHDHVRIYSVDALKSRLESVGFYVDVLTFKEERENRNGFGENETILLAYKQ